MDEINKEQLITPQLYLSGNNLIVSNLDENATSLKLIKNDSEYKTLFIIKDTYTNITAAEHIGLIASGETVTINVTTNSYYKLPDTIIVTGATASWTKTDNHTGKLVLSDPTDAVSFNLVGEKIQLDTPTNLVATGTKVAFDSVENATSYEVYANDILLGEVFDFASYTITPTIANCVAASDNPTIIKNNDTSVALVFTANNGYKLTANSITNLVGATLVSWTLSSDEKKNVGTLVITDPTEDVSFKVASVGVGEPCIVTLTAVGLWRCPEYSKITIYDDYSKTGSVLFSESPAYRKNFPVTITTYSDKCSVVLTSLYQYGMYASCVDVTSDDFVLESHAGSSYSSTTEMYWNALIDKSGTINIEVSDWNTD